MICLINRSKEGNKSKVLPYINLRVFVKNAYLSIIILENVLIRIYMNNHTRSCNSDPEHFFVSVFPEVKNLYNDERYSNSSIICFFFFFLTLQYCIDFAIYQHESATGIHVFRIGNTSLTFKPLLYKDGNHNSEASFSWYSHTILNWES